MSYRVWYVPQLPMDAFTVDVPDLATAVIVEDALCGLSFFEYKNRVKPDYADASGISELDALTGDWVDVSDYEIEQIRSPA